jgi:hypothetical protein
VHFLANRYYVHTYRGIREPLTTSCSLMWWPTHAHQGCQIFPDTTNQNGQKYTKFAQTIPNSTTIWQMTLKNTLMSIKYTKIFIRSPSKIHQNWDIIPSGNPDSHLTLRNDVIRCIHGNWPQKGTFSFFARARCLRRSTKRVSSQGTFVSPCLLLGD